MTIRRRAAHRGVTAAAAGPRPPDPAAARSTVDCPLWSSFAPREAHEERADERGEHEHDHDEIADGDVEPSPAEVGARAVQRDEPGGHGADYRDGGDNRHGGTPFTDAMFVMCHGQANVVRGRAPRWAVGASPGSGGTVGRRS